MTEEKENVKTVYFVRHAESRYNEFKRKPLNWLTCVGCSDPLYYDAELSSKGKRQLVTLERHVERLKLLEEAEIVIVSPLCRALDTALAVVNLSRHSSPSHSSLKTLNTVPHDTILAIDDEDTKGKQSVEMTPINAEIIEDPLIEYKKNYGHFKVDIKSRLPLLISPLCSEIMDTSADVGSSLEDLSAAFPMFHFPPGWKEEWWYFESSKGSKSITDEPSQVVIQRGRDLARFISQLPYTKIIVVSHSQFIKKILRTGSKLPNCGIQRATLRCRVKSEDLEAGEPDFQFEAGPVISRNQSLR
eukprot:TRINITY_DN7655_c0_g1_i1.p1 TRINITY_DN7655_c0_g1~~TRINITY_DN7655_c0_g1_i1.p1  ORF type:complete len:302 (-),score=93.11 TRINITY_DN7655_c0_g1_i1:252-1157(-)